MRPVDHAPRPVPFGVTGHLMPSRETVGTNGRSTVATTGARRWQLMLRLKTLIGPRLRTQNSLTDNPASLRVSTRNRMGALGMSKVRPYRLNPGLPGYPCLQNQFRQQRRVEQPLAYLEASSGPREHVMDLFDRAVLTRLSRWKRLKTRRAFTRFDHAIWICCWTRCEDGISLYGMDWHALPDGRDESVV
jgi:hypothetical protein